MLPEEAYIAQLDSKSGASLKLTVLNPVGRIWTMVAGGGASVIYSDTICDLGGTAELANYGEYSGAPTCVCVVIVLCVCVCVCLCVCVCCCFSLCFIFLSLSRKLTPKNNI
jgi:hypothetical protein